MSPMTPRPIRRILIANRGEIARRIIATAHRLGLQSVVVYSEADADAPFVREADLAIALKGNTSAETYLDTEAVLSAAQASGADAVHPGYGFASENADFAQTVIDAGLTWIGPTPHSIRQMAYKVEAKRLAAEAGVPLVPGAELPAELGDDEMRKRGDEVGFPLLVKASAGGGGKGMRVVSSIDALVDAVASARREAASSFGDGTVFIERYLLPARHIEVQVFGDVEGRVVHLFERECSIQRRHQKIIEESPAARLSTVTAQRMYAAASSLARLIGYVGAGTVEFLVAGDGGDEEFFFLEMNTRLQVEHPVTEAVTGLDLVEWQIRVARGEALPTTQGAITRRGHAIEARLYAEDPANGYLPNTGTITVFDVDPGVRVDSGVEAGSVVSAYYDPMLAKVIAHAPDRLTATDVLSRALNGARIAGVVTNQESLAAICESDPFRRGETTTDFLDRFPEVLARQVPAAVIEAHLAAGALHLAGVTSTPSSTVADAPPLWRNVSGPAQQVQITSVDGRQRWSVSATWHRDGYRIALHAEGEEPWREPRRGFDVEVAPRGDGSPPDLVIDRVRRHVDVEQTGDLLCISDGLHTTQWRVVPRHADRSADLGTRGPSTPVPGTVTMVNVRSGDAVAAGDCLVVLEAMKMEHRIVADVDGTVTEVLVSVGESVEAHTVVVQLDDTSPEGAAP
jgi:propionyl-CoA carboxylase alpha chain